jgi:hypothetical protein
MSDGRMTLPMARGAGETSRRDLWWVQPLLVFTVFTSFVVYATWAAFQNDYYSYGPYLSPFYSPLLVVDSPEQLQEAKASEDRVKRGENQYSHMIFGQRGRPGWWPGWLPFSPALLILGIPVGFRMTCYYYRGAYYKAFWADPLNCAVGEPRKSYWGENTWPLLIQNAHRYFLYLAIIFICLLSYDAVVSYYYNSKLGIGVGSLILTMNAILLGGYTFGCHSLRHLVGGRKDCIGASGATRSMYDCVSCLNRSHMVWAWASLFWVGFSDIYVRLVSMGIWKDFNTWGI